jgi:hypothetical protein
MDKGERTISAHDFRKTVSSNQQPIDTAVLLVLGNDTSINLRQTLDLNIRNSSLEILQSLVRSIGLVEVFESRLVNVDSDS